jgi:hypothetical protein
MLVSTSTAEQKLVVPASSQGQFLYCFDTGAYVRIADAAAPVQVLIQCPLNSVADCDYTVSIGGYDEANCDAPSPGPSPINRPPPPPKSPPPRPPPRAVMPPVPPARPHPPLPKPPHPRPPPPF